MFILIFFILFYANQLVRIKTKWEEGAQRINFFAILSLINAVTDWEKKIDFLIFKTFLANLNKQKIIYHF